VKGQALVAAGAALLALAAGGVLHVRAADACAMDAQPEDSPPPPPCASIAVTSRAAAPFGEGRARASTPPMIRVLAAPGTPTFGTLRVVRRAGFAPSVQFDAELWDAFARGPRGDLAKLIENVFDRLARLGYETVAACDWRHAEPLTIDRAATDTIVALSSQSVTHAASAGLDRAALELRTVGAADLRADGDGELWAWSECAFPGPHRADVGRLVPAARTHAVFVRRGPALCVRFCNPVEPLAGGVCNLVAAPCVADRQLDVDGPLWFSRDDAAHAAVGHLLPLGDPHRQGRVQVREEGTPFGTYRVRGTDGGFAVVVPVR
jgi:hypothetical protein